MVDQSFLSTIAHNFIVQVPALAVTRGMYDKGFDINKDGALTMAELATVIFKEKLNGPLPKPEVKAGQM